jgi:peptidyl-prolyl cis-trans isomerase SurA
MQLKTRDLKFTKYIYQITIVVIAILSNNLIFSQDNMSTNGSKKKIDGVAAVVGDFLVLDSDIDKQFDQLKASGISTDDMTRCQVFGKLLEDKLYQHHAIQDSIVVNNLEIQSFVDQQIDAFAEQIGSMDKLVAYYKKSSEQNNRWFQRKTPIGFFKTIIEYRLDRLYKSLVLSYYRFVGIGP